MILIRSSASWFSKESWGFCLRMVILVLKWAQSFSRRGKPKRSNLSFSMILISLTLPENRSLIRVENPFLLKLRPEPMSEMILLTPDCLRTEDCRVKSSFWSWEDTLLYFVLCNLRSKLHFSCYYILQRYGFSQCVFYNIVGVHRGWWSRELAILCDAIVLASWLRRQVLRLFEQYWACNIPYFIEMIRFTQIFRLLSNTHL